MAGTPASSRFSATGSIYRTATLTAAPNAFRAFSWTTLSSGPAILDLTAPTAPVAVRAGLYVVSAWVQLVSAVVAGAYFLTELDLDSQNDDAEGVAIAPLFGLVMAPSVTVTVAYKVPAGGEIDLAVYHETIGNLDFGAIVSIAYAPTA